MFFVCLCLPSVIFVYCNLVVTCWERADLLALLCMTFSCVLSLSHMVSWIICGTCLYGFLLSFFKTLQYIFELALEMFVLIGHASSECEMRQCIRTVSPESW